MKQWKLIFTVLYFIITEFNSIGQNLVPNWSFEDTLSCPVGGGQISQSTGWISYKGTPDYCNACNGMFQSVPDNQWGFQYAKTGQAYAGAIAYYTYGQLRECIGTQLLQSLIIGQKYYASFYVSLAYNVQTSWFGIGSSKFGIKLSTVPYSNASPIPIDNIAHIYTDSVITDTSQWKRISGSFIADSAYTYLSIGNFFADSLTHVLILDSSAHQSYFFIDDVILSVDSNCCSTKNISEEEYSSKIKIFPNPTDGIITIQAEGGDELNIYDSLGQIIYTEYNPKFSSTINLSSYPKGIYLITILSKNDLLTDKIIFP